MSLGVDRILASLIDILCTLPWIGVVAAAGAVLWTAGITESMDAVSGNIVGFVLLIAPITFVAAGLEASGRHATPGKRLRRLRVTGRRGVEGGYARALARNAVKYALPWELGHTAVFALVGTTAAPPAWVVVVLIAAFAIPIASLVLLLAVGRPLHDLITGTVVERATA